MSAMFLRISIGVLNKCKPLCIKHRQITYFNSPFVVDVEHEKVKYEVTNLVEDWKNVERALPFDTVQIPTPKDKYPSEWKPQGNNHVNNPYFVSRTKNHMLPVYLYISQRGIRRITKVKNVQGDIWLLEKQLRNFIQPMDIRPLRSQVNEFAGYIRFYGDYVNAIKHWLLKHDL